MPLFEKKNPIVEAVQFNGTNEREIHDFLRNTGYTLSWYLESMFLHNPDSTETAIIPKDGWVILGESGNISVHSNHTFKQNYKEKA